MKKFVLTALAGTAALGIAACDNSPDTVEEGDTTITTEPMPTATETTTVDPTLTDPAADPNTTTTTDTTADTTTTE